MNRFLVKKTRTLTVKKNASSSSFDKRIYFLMVFFIFFAVMIFFRLIKLQVVDHAYYYALAYDQHEIFQQLYPKRGTIYIQQKGMSAENSLYPVAVNKELNLVFVEPKNVTDPEAVMNVLLEVLDFSDEIKKAQEEVVLPTLMELTAEQLEKEKLRLEKIAEQEALEMFKAKLLEKLSKADDPYEPIKHRVSDVQIEQLATYNLEGLRWIKEAARYYPEGSIGSQLYGFVGHSSEDNLLKGYYGIEGAYNDVLSGQAGFLKSELDLAGRWIAVAGKEFKKAQDGSDIVLTIDKAIQFYTCEQLFYGVKNFGADSGNIIIMEPQTGRILAMCSFPDFDPNNYNKVEDMSVFNNSAIFESYEPGSSFKPITMAAGLDTGEITPYTSYEDTGEVVIYDHTIKNSDEKANGWQNMTEILEKSLNTGTIFVVRKVGQERFTQYLKNFGFGQKTEIDLNSEATGNLTSLDYVSKNDINLATASFGQGITVTSIQMVKAFAAIANEGKLVQPHVIDRILAPDGQEEIVSDKVIGQVISPKTAKLLGSMLVSVVENGHATKAQVPGYLIAGKTGTAQVADLEKGGYSEKTIQTFAGFAPYEDPKFVMIVKLENAQNSSFAADSAAPIFSKIAKFIFDYYNIAPTVK